MFYMPTKVISGAGCVKNNALVFSQQGKRALIVTGKSSAKLSGALDDVQSVLEGNNQSYAVFDEVTENPATGLVYRGAQFAKANQADFIIAIGGGSPLDAAKTIAMLSRQDIPEDKLFDGIYTDDVLPMIHIPTTAGTGSEVTPYSILTYDKIQSKISLASPSLFARIALLDYRYTATLPLSATINTALDALSHSVEGMLALRSNRMSDVFAKESIKIISGSFNALLKNNITDEIRENLLYASMLGGIVISHTGTTGVHSMGYSLTYFKNIPHGRANALILPQFLSLLSKHCADRVNDILKCGGFSDCNMFQETIDALLGEKEQLCESEIERFTDIAMKARSISNSIYAPSLQQVKELYSNLRTCIQ